MSSLIDKHFAEAKKRCRVRDLGITIGHFKPGPLNAITDVAGVRVGHTTLIEGSGRRKPGTGPVRTGVTIILPSGDIFENKMLGNGFILNGAGELAGLTQAMEWGLIETPIGLTNTHSVGRVGDAIIHWMAQRYERIHKQQEVVIPLVGECDDSFLNDVVGSHIKTHHVVSAIEHASAGPVEEGCVGAGTGMICCDFKAGIGTSSRQIQMEDKIHTIGVLVLSNFGVMEDFRVDGFPIGTTLAKKQGKYDRRTSNIGSIITVVATDLPLNSIQIQRLCKRVALGIGRAGTYASHFSGEIVLGFSTANVVPANSIKPKIQITILADPHLDPAYQAVIEATEEAILNSITTSVEMEGAGGRKVPAIDLPLLKKLYHEYKDIESRS